MCFISLTGCFGGNDSTVSTGLEWYQGDKFSLQVPASWTVFTDQESLFPQPSRGEIELVSVSENEKFGWQRNLVVLSDTLEQVTTSTDFSILEQVQSRSQYEFYRELENVGIDFNDGEQGKVYVFEARYNRDTPILKYIQVARVCYPDTVYVATISVPTELKKHTQYIDMFKTFTCKQEG
ncbi:hypothetical protein MK079_04795 [Candidatus Gracilibacteria bacterium]|nr:hypothetical protein [Candidatus Gracilibacteria bacterium]